jgi:hypothetical protein
MAFPGGKVHQEGKESTPNTKMADGMIDCGKSQKPKAW